jgi:hypothetical protein
MQRTLITIGIAVLVTGLLWPWLSRLGLGRLPGDLRIQTATACSIFRSRRACSCPLCCRSSSGYCVADALLPTLQYCEEITARP